MRPYVGRARSATLSNVVRHSRGVPRSTQRKWPLRRQRRSARTARFWDVQGAVAKVRFRHHLHTETQGAWNCITNGDWEQYDEAYWSRSSRNSKIIGLMIVLPGRRSPVRCTRANLLISQSFSMVLLPVISWFIGAGPCVFCFETRRLSTR